jgi:hypothetical protein
MRFFHRKLKKKGAWRLNFREFGTISKFQKSKKKAKKKQKSKKRHLQILDEIIDGKIILASINSNKKEQK